MTNKKQLLDFAFNEAINTMSVNVMDAELTKEYLKTQMFGYAERAGYDFTEEEVNATIVAGLETIAKSGSDFKIQTWTMK